jgi:hypothetical protein
MIALSHSDSPAGAPADVRATIDTPSDVTAAELTAVAVADAGSDSRAGGSVTSNNAGSGVTVVVDAATLGTIVKLRFNALPGGVAVGSVFAALAGVGIPRVVRTDGVLAAVCTGDTRTAFVPLVCPWSNSVLMAFETCSDRLEFALLEAHNTNLFPWRYDCFSV